MRLPRLVYIMGLWIVLLAVGVDAAGRVETREVKRIGLGGTPLATAYSYTTRNTFVLLEGGKVDIYSQKGELVGSIEVGKGATNIQVAPDGFHLLVTDRDKRALRVIEVNFIAEFDISGSPVAGRPDAPVTVVEFSDFQCPYCARASRFLKEILKEFPNDVRLVYKAFPLRKHTYSMKAVVAALAAGEQGKFWEYYDLVFKNYRRLNNSIFMSFARELGLDLAKFQKDKADPQVIKMVRRDMAEGRKFGVRGTPTFFVNGRRVRRSTKSAIVLAIRRELDGVGRVKPTELPTPQGGARIAPGAGS